MEKATAAKAQAEVRNLTDELKFNDWPVYGIYHSLWRIEMSFRMMKSHLLDARPIYLTDMNSINDHFHTSTTSLSIGKWLLKFKVLGSRFSHEKIMDFIRFFFLERPTRRTV